MDRAERSGEEMSGVGPVPDSPVPTKGEAVSPVGAEATRGSVPRPGNGQGHGYGYGYGNGDGYPRYPSSPFDGAGSGGGLRDYWGVLYEHRWVIATVFAIVTAATWIFVHTRKPLYTATVTIQIDRESPNILTFQDVAPVNPGYTFPYDEYTQTQCSILKSRALAARVIKQLDLDRTLEPGDPGGGGKGRPALGRLKDAARGGIRWLLSGGKGQAPIPSRQPEESGALGVDKRLISAFLAGVEVKPIRDTRLVAVSYTSPDPAQSSRIANGIAAGYQAYSLETRFELSTQARDFLEKQLHDLEERVRSSETDLDRFRQAKQIVSLESGENTVMQKLQQVNQQLTDAEAERIAKEAQYSLVKSGTPESLPAVLASPLIAELKERYAELEREYGRLSQKFLPGYPQMVQLESQMAEARASLSRETARIAQGVEREYLAAKEKELSLSTQLDSSQQQALGQKSVAIQYALLKREVDTNRQLHDSLLQRMKETTVAAGLKTGNIRTVDAAEIPAGPSYPRKNRTLLIGMMMGLLVGVGFAFLLSYLDDSVRTPEAVTRILGLPSLALIPAMRGSRGISLVKKLGRAGTKGKREEKGPSDKHPRIELVTAMDGGTPISEAYRIFRTSLLLSNAEQVPRSILFTSSIGGEGKTSTAINTCVALAQAGRTVVLFDADLRRPRIHKALELPNARGLSTFLQGEPDLRSMAVSVLHENLWVITGGPVPLNPSELLGSNRMARVVGQLTEAFDFVVLDSSPVLPVADALELSRMVDGVILVVDSSRTPRDLVQAAHQRLVQSHAKMLGVVLNKVGVGGGYGYSHRHYHDYYSTYQARLIEEEPPAE